MDHAYIIRQLEQNREVIYHLLKDATQEEYLWRPQPEKWCLLEILCHLADEELEDFRTRTQHVLETPEGQPPPIFPDTWVKERNYVEQDYEATLNRFLDERATSVEWLHSLLDPEWENAYMHRVLGPLSGNLFLSNWLAHDQTHIQQIMRLKLAYLKHISGEDLEYAGGV